MRVGTLIEILETMSSEAEVRLHHPMGEEVLFALKQQGNDKTVWFETESDTNMREELRARFDSAAAELGIDETYFYDDLLKAGIGVEMVRKYIGNEAAEHMREFCIAYGLL